MIISFYVDDILISRNSLELVTNLKADFWERFGLGNRGEAKICFALKICRKRGKRVLASAQDGYVSKNLRLLDMTLCKSVSLPVGSQLNDKVFNTEPSDSTLYRNAIGNLMYLMICTRPDITFRVSRVLQFIETSLVGLWTCVKSVFRCIRVTKTYGIRISSEDKAVIAHIGYKGANWAGCKLSRRPVPGFVFTIAGEAVSLKKRSAKPNFATEAGYMAPGLSVIKFV